MRNILRRKNMFLESYNNCVLCQAGVEETRDHLFQYCTFARSCRSLLGMNPPLNCSFPEVVIVMKAQLRSEFFLNAVILMS
jgi:hypothetical protein